MTRLSLHRRWFSLSFENTRMLRCKFQNVRVELLNYVFSHFTIHITYVWIELCDYTSQNVLDVHSSPLNQYALNVSLPTMQGRFHCCNVVLPEHAFSLSENSWSLPSLLQLQSVLINLLTFFDRAWTQIMIVARDVLNAHFFLTLTQLNGVGKRIACV